MDWIFEYGFAAILGLIALLFICFVNFRIGYAIGKQDLEALRDCGGLGDN